MSVQLPAAPAAAAPRPVSSASKSPGGAFHLQARPLASSATTYVAGMLAMFISMCLNLPRPWWVLMTVYVTTQPLAGSLRPKMKYRLIGVGVGATAAVAATTLCINSPFLMSFALAVWVGGCLCLAVLDRTPRTFGFMLAGYTAAIVAFPYIDTPGDIFLIAAARVEEMVIAIVTALVVHSVLLPWQPVSILESRLPAFLADARGWFVDALKGLHGFRADQERRRFAADIAELSILAVHLPPEALRAGATRRHVGAFQGCLSTLLPLVSAAEDRIRALRERGALAEPVARLVEDVSAWLAGPEHASQAAAEVLQVRCRALAPALEGVHDWTTLLTASLCQRLSDVVGAYADAHALMRHLTGEARLAPAYQERLLRRAAPRLRTDLRLALLSGAAGACAVMAYCTGWILLSWPEGSATAAFAAIVSCSFASQDDPAPAIRKYLGFTLLALPVSAFYLFAVLPRVDGVLALVIALLPVLLVMGYVQADPAHAPHALPMLACFIVAMGFLERYTADFARFLNVAFAQMGGVVVTMVPARLFRSVGAEWMARRLLRRGWREVADLAGRRVPVDELAWSQKMVDGVGLVAARMAYLRLDEQLKAADPLGDLRLGRNVLHLRGARAGGHAPALDRVLSEVAALYEERARRGTPVAPPPALLSAIDGALVELGRGSGDDAGRKGLLALAAMRRNLFAAAPAYEGGLAA